MDQVKNISSRAKDGRKVIISFSDNPYETIKNILNINQINLEEGTILKIVAPLNDILISDNQNVTEKKSALELLMYLFFKYRKTIKWKKIIENLLNNPNLYSYKTLMFLDNASLNVVKFYIAILKFGFKINKSDDFLIQIAKLGNFSDYDKICVFKELGDLLSLTNFKKIITKEINSSLIGTFVENSVCRDIDVSYFAVKSLCFLLDTNKKESILSYLDMNFPYFSWKAKKAILTYIKGLNEPIVERIQNQGKADSNFYIRSL